MPDTHSIRVWYAYVTKNAYQTRCGNYISILVCTHACMHACTYASMFACMFGCDWPRIMQVLSCHAPSSEIILSCTCLLCMCIVCVCVCMIICLWICCHAFLLCAQLFVWVCCVCVCLCVDNKQGPVSISESESVCVWCLCVCLCSGRFCRRAHLLRSLLWTTKIRGMPPKRCSKTRMLVSIRSFWMASRCCSGVSCFCVCVCVCCVCWKYVYALCVCVRVRARVFACVHRFVGWSA